MIMRDSLANRYWRNLMKSQHFNDDDFKCRCGCGMDISDKLKCIVFEMREDAGVPFIVTSGARCVAHNSKVGGKQNSAHTRGLAVDIAYSDSRVRYAIEHHAHLHGIKRIGVNTAKKFIHIDIDDTLPQCVSFEY